MVSARKRPLDGADPMPADPPKAQSMLHRVRNLWQFANLCQWLLIFGPAVKVDSIEADDLEVECLSPHSMALQEIGLALLKFLSSHRGLTHELFDEYTKRQFASKAPETPNPFGDDEVAAKFSEFDVFKKIRVLQQMTVFIMIHPEKIREKMAELKDADHDQTSWRIEPFGWDRHNRTYYVLDDNRLYRMTDPPLAAAKPKKNTKKARAAARASKRRRISSALDSGAEDAGDEATENETEAQPVNEDDGLGGMIWECLAVTLDEVNEFLATLAKAKDADEKVLRDQIQEHLAPILEGQEERRKKRERERERELLNLEKLANAKRSSRLANKVEQQRQQEHMHEQEKQRLVEEAAERKAAQQQRKMELERDNRMKSREVRLREREKRRLKHEDDLAQLSEDSKGLGSAAGRMSERRRQAEIERNKKALQDLDEEEEDWVFDCVCGLHGQVDDGQHSVACERCNVWQHSKCLGIEEHEAERDDFHFICDSCHQRQEEKERVRPRIKIKVNRSAPSADAIEAPDAALKPSSLLPSGPQVPPITWSTGLVIEIAGQPPPELSISGATPHVNGVSTPYNAGANGHRPSQSILMPPHMPPRQDFNNSIPVKPHGASTKVSLAEAGPHPTLNPNGVHNPFSSPHPDLSPPHQSPNKSRAYGTIYDQSSPIPPPVQDGQSRIANSTPLELAGGSQRKISTTSILPPTIPRAPYVGANSATAVTGSPSKPPIELAANPGKAPVDAASNLASSQRNHQTTPSSLMVTPQFTRTEDRLIYDQKSSPLPPSLGGLSPTKHSPPMSQGSFRNGLPSSSPTPPILPPVAALSPCLGEQNLSPPVKTPQPPLSEANLQ